MKKPNRLDLLRGEQASSLVELAAMLPVFMLLLVGAVDFGRAYYLAIQVAGAAQAGATYGSQNPHDTTGMTAAAMDDAPNVPNVSVSSATSGCECADGTGYSANCSSTPSCPSNNVVYRVNITVQGTYTPILPWPGIPSTIALTSSASMRSAGS